MSVSLLVLGVIVVLGAIAATVVVFVLPGDKGNGSNGPHRVAGEQPSPPANDASPQWDAPSHTWVALSEDWTVPQVDKSPHAYGLASDDQRVFTLRKPLGDLGESLRQEPEAELTAYDGASGKRLWRKTLPWIQDASPVASNGIVVVPSGKQEDGSVTGPQAANYIAFDSATGAERWRVKVSQRATFPTVISRPGNAPGVFFKGVFYYGDGPKLVGVDPATGRVRYQTAGKNHVIVAGPVVAGGRITVIAEEPFNPSAPSYVRTAFMFTPDLKGQVSSDFPEHAKPEAITASGDVLVAWGANVIWATDARNGRGLWSKQLPDLTETTGVLGKVIIVHDFRDNAKKKFLGYDLLSGKQLWTTIPPNLSGSTTESFNVGIADGTLFALAHGITIINATNGEKVFTHSTNRGGGLVTTAAGRIVVYNQDGITGFK